MGDFIATAESAQDVAAALDKFLDHIPEYDAEITALIGECFGLSSALRQLNTCYGDLQFHNNYVQISNDIHVTLQSINYTFDDVHGLLTGLGSSLHLSRTAAYRAVWDNIIVHFDRESNNSLGRRIGIYRRFLGAVICLIEGDWLTLDEYNGLRWRIDSLFRIQDNRLALEMNNLALGAPGANRQRSFERRRSAGIRPPLPPSPPPFRREGVPRAPPMSPLTPGFDQGDFWSPNGPSSPITTNTSSTTQSSRATFATTHWVPKLFDQNRPASEFRRHGQVSACFDEDMRGAGSRLSQEYEKLMEQSFEEGDLVVRIYLRQSDHRARIYCRSQRGTQPRKESCLPLTSLRIQRRDSCLELRRMNQSGDPTDIWARLRFLNLERLVLFHCTFLALKAEDPENRSHQTVDDTIHGEVKHFGQYIQDDQYEHALRLFKDRDSGAVRLQASVRRGDLKRTPVWTAFITHQIASRDWMRRPRSNPRAVYLAELQQFVFTNEYNPQLGPDGAHELRFHSSGYATEFIDAIEELARRRS